jgi:hypothetical protein
MTDARALRTALTPRSIRRLLEAQRVQAERFGGRMAAGEVLQVRLITFTLIGYGSSRS